MTSGRDEYISKHIDYEAESKRRIDHINLTGGNVQGCLTVRDYFAARVMGAMIGVIPKTVKDAELAEAAYLIADAMLKQREKFDANN